MLSPSTRTLAGLLLLLAIGLAVYGPALDRVFVYDDILTIRDNDFITEPGNLLHLTGESYLHAAGERTYRPLVTATYIVDHMIWGKAPFGFGLTNLLLHILTAWLLMLLLPRLTERPRIALPAALLYLAHPALVEAVISPGNREEILSVLLALLAAYAWLRGRDGARTGKWAAPLLLLASLYTMEWGVVLPVFLFLWALQQGDSLGKALREVGWLLAATALFLALYLFVHPRLPGETEWLGGDRWHGILAFGTLFWKYVRLTLLPVALRPSYTYFAPPLWVSLAGLTALTALAVAILHGLWRRRAWAPGAALFGMALAPVSHVLIPFWIPMAERYLYLPLLAGVPLLTAALLSPRFRRVGPVLLVLIAVFFGLGTSTRALQWRTPLLLWSNAVDREPLDPVSWTNYGAGLAAYDRFAEAADAHRRAWEISKRQGKDNANQLIHYAVNLSLAGQKQQAFDAIKKHRPDYPEDVDLLFALGRLHIEVKGPCFLKEFDPYRTIMHLTGPEERDRIDPYCRAWAAHCYCPYIHCLEQQHNETWKRCATNGHALMYLASVHAAAGNGEKMVRAIGRAMKTRQWPVVRGEALALLHSVKK